MLCQQSPLPWTCLPTAFANVLDVEINRFLKDIGHDGSEILYPNRPGVLSRRSFHPQECIAVAWERGFAVTCFERTPKHGISATEFHELDYSRGFELTMQRFSGVLVGAASRNRHAVAWDAKHQVVIDNGVPKTLPVFFGDTFFAITRFNRRDYRINDYPALYPEFLPTQEQKRQGLLSIPKSLETEINATENHITPEKSS